MQGIIHLENIRKSYYLGKNELPVLKGISLDIFKNEYVALMGPSGSGKSTLMNILGCLDTASAGKYILNGKDVSRMPDNDLAEVRNKEIGFVFQQFNLLPRLTAVENVALPLIYSGIAKKERIERAEAVLGKVKLLDRMHHKPNELSGGQCQRVAIARALVKNPPLLILDEPCQGLNEHEKRFIKEVIDSICRQTNRALIYVSHYEEEIPDCVTKFYKL